MRRKILSWKVVKYLIATALILQFVALWIQSHSSNINEEINTIGESVLMHEKSLFEVMLDSVHYDSQFDSSNQYKFILDVFNKKQAAHSQIVTLISHCSEDQLHLLPDLLQHWKGLLSISVFVTRNGLADIFNLQRCFPMVKSNVIFNVVFPSPDSPYDIFHKNITCHRNIKYPPKNSFELSTAYPINLMRNVAKKGAQSLYDFVIDIDMIPNQSLHSDLNKFLVGQPPSRGSEKIVYVIPAYELREDVLLPSNKMELLKLRNRQLVRPFYQELCEKCQIRTDYSSWENASNFKGRLHPLYNVTWGDSWEPFYVSRSSVPAYDERFKQYGFNRISQVCELHQAGYSFLVLNNGFLLHRGLKNNFSHHRSKRKELIKNYILYDSFKHELIVKYPNSRHKRC